MADSNNSGGVDTSVYRQQPQTNPLQMITQIGQAADSLGNIAVGQGVQQAIDPETGQIDRNKLAGLLKGSIAGSMKAIPTLNALEQLRSAGYQADQQGLETFQKRMAITHHLFSGLASKDNPTMDDVYDVATRALDPALEAKKYGITLPVVMNAIKAFRNPDGTPLKSAQIKQKALEIQTQAASTSEILHQHSPGMQVVQRADGTTEFVPAGTGARPATGTVVPGGLPPSTPVATPRGTQMLGQQPGMSQPAAVPPGGPAPNFDERFGTPIGAGGAAPPPAAVAAPVRSPAPPATTIAPPGAEPPGSPSAPRGVPTQTITPTGPMTSLRPGYTEAATEIGKASGQQAVALAQANDGSTTRKAMLGNLEDDLGKFTAGGGADWTRIAKNWTNRNIPVPPSWQEPGEILDPKSVASQEQFNKQAAMLAQQQFSAIGGTGTDAKFSSAFTTSPNETLSQLGNHGIIRLLKGNEDAIQAKNTAWNKWKKDKGPDTYSEFSEDFNDRFDPRAFQFKYLKPEERNDYIKGMEPDERAKFLHDLTYARKQGWIKFTPSP